MLDNNYIKNSKIRYLAIILILKKIINNKYR